MIPLDVVIVPDHLAHFVLERSAVVVIDVLRATTSIAVALHSGARGILPIMTVEEAIRISGNMRRDGESVLLCGEVGGLPPEGFDLGNSPREFVPERVLNRRIMLKTTNGTVALVRSQTARYVLAGALVNLSAVAEFLHSHLESDSLDRILCVCAGREGDFSLEDFFTAGGIVDRLQDLYRSRFDLGDSAVAALEYFQSHRDNPLAVLEQSRHGRVLKGLGLGADLPACAAYDSYPVVPLCGSEGWIEKAEI
ncbi:MAG TPA: 2-phosphosulfolactate phosphatase [bacterium]|nr:2-phosphosulfolactate phosphatase [bacterium]HQO35928.1 2-phosphosulfolactate phosphatase [bacterium]HQP98157.1 2-phosphosulfolactate phosphatase [bacterium]